MGYSVRRRSCCGLGDTVSPIPDLTQLPLSASAASSRGTAVSTISASQASLAQPPSFWSQINAWFNQESIKGVKNGYLVAGGGGLIFLAALAGGKRR